MKMTGYQLKSYRNLAPDHQAQADTLPVPAGVGLDDPIFMLMNGKLHLLDTQVRGGRHAGDWGWYCRICRVAFSNDGEHRGCNGQYLYVVATEAQGRQLEALPSLRSLWEVETEGQS